MKRFDFGWLVLALCAAACSSDSGGDNKDPEGTGANGTGGANAAGTDDNQTTAGGNSNSSLSNGSDGGQGSGQSTSGPPVVEPPRDVTTVTPLAEGCADQQLREGIPEDLGKAGPWPVGELETTLGGIKAEVWYPAKQGSEADMNPQVYDIREHLPDEDQAKIPDDHNPWQPCDCYRGLPLDDEAGPYPVIVFVHGTAGFRTTNLENATHWASRGFVVVAADHPGITLKDALTGLGVAGIGSATQEQDARDMLADLAKAASIDDLKFLDGHLDLTRVGALGHSAGAGAVSALTDVADVIIPYAGGSAMTPDRVKSVMTLYGSTDGVAGSNPGTYSNTTTSPKRYLSITKGGHLVGGSLCVMRDPTDESKDIVDLAEEYKVASGGVIGLIGIRMAFGALFDGCNADAPDQADGEFIAASRGIEIMNYATTGVFEEALHCSASTTAALLTAMPTKFGADVTAYMEELP